MSDLISRDDAIKDAESWVGMNWYEQHLIRNVIEWLKEFPPAELSPNLAEVGTDCISREQAIKTVGWYSCHSGDKLLFADNALRQLPPIQPKRGKWIKTARWGRVYYCNQCRNYLDFDGVNAGRGSTNFCPNCGADMREVTNGN